MNFVRIAQAVPLVTTYRPSYTMIPAVHKTLKLHLSMGFFQQKLTTLLKNISTVIMSAFNLKRICLWVRGSI